MPLIIDGNKIVDTPVSTIIDNLKAQCLAMGIDKLKDIEYKGNNIRITCPVHKGGHENTPSCDILLVDKTAFNKEIPAGTVNCFACGYKAGLVKFIKDVLNISYRKALDWLLSFVDYTYLSDDRRIDDIFENSSIKDNYDTLPEVTSEELKKYDYIHEYMFTRKLTEDVIDKFEVGYDPETDCLTFPVYSDGKCLFVARRKVNRKMFLMPEIEPKPIYGLDYINGCSEVYVCESILNALTLWGCGKPAIALFGTGSRYQINILNKSDIRKFILCLDPDEAGRKGAKRIEQGLSSKIITRLNIPDGKDINDLSNEEIESLDELF